MASPSHVVVLEPTPKSATAPAYFEGDILDGNAARLADLAQHAVLPVDPELAAIGAGWTKRSFGRGLVMHDVASVRAAHLVLPISPERQMIHWLAEVVPSAEFVEMSGVLRLISDTQHVMMSVGLQQAVAGSEFLGEAGCRRLLVGGSAKTNISVAMIGGFALYGTLQRARLRWLAVSQTR